jgi:hypothetical protein
MELLHLAQLAKAPSRAWIAGGVFVENSLICLFGQPASGKSFVAIDFAMSIATGLREWQGAPMSGRAEAVVYVAGEGSAGLHDRIAAWQSHHCDEIPSKCEGIPFYYLPRAVNLSSAAEVTVFLKALQTVHGGIKLVVFDTLARCAVGVDENSSQEMGVVVSHADRIRRETGAAVMLVHHSGKVGPGSMRGSSSLLSAADTAVAVLRDPHRTKQNPSITLRVVKQKDGEGTETRHALRACPPSLVLVSEVGECPPPSPPPPPCCHIPVGFANTNKRKAPS